MGILIPHLLCMPASRSWIFSGCREPKRTGFSLLNWWFGSVQQQLCIFACMACGVKIYSVNPHLLDTSVGLGISCTPPWSYIRTAAVQKYASYTIAGHRGSLAPYTCPVGILMCRCSGHCVKSMQKQMDGSGSLRGSWTNPVESFHSQPDALSP
jgi:hypothetical protein